MKVDKRPFITAMSIRMCAVVIPFPNGAIVGELQSSFLDEPYVFTSLIQMIRKMEDIFDIKKFPQSSVKLRSFDKKKQGSDKSEAERRISMIDNNSDISIPEEQENARCTFEIAVRFRQNASWQGEILWAEKNMRQNFRSVLEMLKLMDEALTEGSDITRSPNWKD